MSQIFDFGLMFREKQKNCDFFRAKKALLGGLRGHNQNCYL